jgi:hypothetical protein
MANLKCVGLNLARDYTVCQSSGIADRRTRVSGGPWRVSQETSE